MCCATAGRPALPRSSAEARPGISILKPLCGVDDDLEANLAQFASLDYPRYEVLLGVKDTRDPAYAVARAAVARWPQVMRLVLQEGEPGLNPKVNQLVTLSSEARYDAVGDQRLERARGAGLPGRDRRRVRGPGRWAA